MASMDSAEPGVKGSLVLESLVLPEDRPMENQPSIKKDVLKREAATTLNLWYD